MLVNHGRQAVYNRAGNKVRCAECRWYGAHPAKAGVMWCPVKKWYPEPDGNCTSFEREPGSDA